MTKVTATYEMKNSSARKSKSRRGYFGQKFTAGFLFLWGYMKKIKLTQGKYALVDDEDFEELNKHKWYFQKRSINKNSRLKPLRIGCAKRGIMSGDKQTQISMHQVIMNTPVGMATDHIDGNQLNNQKSNLRICTFSQNSQNRGRDRDGKSGYKGVTIKTRGHCKGIIAQIGINGKQKYIGSFSRVIEAAKAYNKEAKKLHGEFARLNEISEGGL